MPAIANLTQPLSDGEVALRFSAERDIPEILIAYQDDRQLHERLGEDRPPSGAELGRRSEQAEADRSEGRHAELTVTRAGADECVGQIRVHHIDWANSRAELGIWLAPQVRGRGWAGRALRLACGWLFRECGLERVQLATEPDNELMRRAAAAAGFAEEGVLRGYTLERGARVDCVMLSLLAGELEGRL